MHLHAFITYVEARLLVGIPFTYMSNRVGLHVASPRMETIYVHQYISVLAQDLIPSVQNSVASLDSV